MKIIQVILIVAIIFIMISYLRRFRSAAIDKIFVSGLFLLGIVFILFPDMTNKLARLLGIGRGADLIFYLAIMGFGYIVVILYAKIKKLEDLLTTLVRNQSLANLNNHKEKA